MNTFEITIRPKTDNGWPVTVKYTPGQYPLYYQGTLKLNSEDNFLEIEQYRGSPKKYGEELGKKLFIDDIKLAFQTALNDQKNSTGENSKKKPDKLHVFLHIDTSYNKNDISNINDDDGIKNLRWERLCAPFSSDSEGWEFLSIDVRTPFSFFIPTMVDRLFPVIGRNDLRTLIVAANPSDPEKKYGLANFNVQETVDSVKTSLDQIPCDVLAKDVDGTLGLPTLENIKKYLSSEKKYYTLLHLVCHGKLVNGETVIYLTKDDNTIDPVRASELINQLKDLPHAPHFAFLSTCESASPESEQMAGLAQSLAQKLGMPAVLGMTAPVTIDTAQHLAKNFYQRLREDGDVSLALSEALVELRRNRHDITVPVLFSRLGGQPIFSKKLDRPLTNSEIKTGLERIEDLLPIRAPILLEEFKSLKQKLNNLNIDFKALSLAEQTKREEALRDLNRLCDQVLDISFDALVLDGEVTNYDPRCPFQGLKAFRQEDKDFFCGRKELVKSLKETLKKQNFLAVLGPSGSGKSSVVLAGLIPVLEQENPGIEIIELTPNDNPMERLQKKRSEVKQSSFILVVDQFEEVFTLCTKENKKNQKPFIAELLEIAKTSKVIITMRADFWGECAYHEQLKKVMQENQFLISPMNAEELREAIEEQAEKVGLRFEAGVVNLIIKDIEGEPGEMPLLQYALEELWQRRRGKWLLCEEYEEIGFKDSITRIADRVYDKLPSQIEKEEVKNIFLRLIRLEPSLVQDEKPKYTRQRVYLEALSPKDNLQKQEEIHKLVDLLAGPEARLIVTSAQGGNPEDKVTVEVAHEALITHWGKLQKWLEEDSVNLLLRQSIGDAALNWKQENELKKKDNFLLHHGFQLEEVEKLLNRTGFFDNNHIEYVKACREKENCQKGKELEQVIATHTAYSKLLFVFVSNQKLDALVELIKAGEKLQQGIKISAAAEFSFLVTFGQMFAETYEFNSLTSHKDKVLSVTCHPNEPIIASVSQDKTIKLWNYHGQEIQTITGHTGWVTDVSFSFDGNFLASASIDNTIRLWQRQESSDPTQWESVQTLEGHNDWILAVKFSPKGNIIASGSKDNTVILWHSEDNVYIPKILSDHTDQVVDVAFSPDGEMVASASKDTTIKLWTLEGELIRTIKGHEKTVTSVSFVDSQTLISSSEDKIIILWDVNGNQLGHNYESLESPVNSVAFSQKCQKIVSAHEDGTIMIWKKDNDSLTKLQTLKGHKHKEEVLKVSFSSDSNIIVSCSRDKTVKLWQGYNQFEGYSAKIIRIDFSTDGQMIAIASEDGTVKLWNSQGQLLQNLSTDDSEIVDVKFNPVGNTIATASKDGTLKLWNLEGQLQKTKTFESSNGNELKNISFSPDGTMIAIANDDPTIQLWNLDNNTIEQLSQYEAGINQVTFSPDGKMIASVNWDKTVALWNVDGWKIHKILKNFQWNVDHVIFSPNGQTIATVSSDETTIWNLQGELKQTIENNEGVNNLMINAYFLQKNSDILALIRNKQRIELWNIEGQLMQAIDPIDESYIDIAGFSPDGSAVAIANSEGQIKLWHLDLDKILKNSQDFIQDYLRLPQ